MNSSKNNPNNQNNLGSKPEDQELADFFTNAEEARHAFSKYAAQKTKHKQLFSVCGIGGIGKSTLLRMFRLHCNSQNMFAVIVDAQETPSPSALLTIWFRELEGAGYKCPSFHKVLARHRQLQSSVEQAVQQEEPGSPAQKLGKALVHGVIQMMASAVPVVGPLLASFGELGGDSLLGWLQDKFGKEDTSFFLDPTEELTRALLDDVTRITEKHKLVLMLDTYERFLAFDSWTANLVKALPQNLFPVLAGRVAPDWEKYWPGWPKPVELVELEAMTDSDLEQLVRRYYRYIGGGEVDDDQAKLIVRFARGLPIAATTVVKLWARYKTTDFQAVRARVVADVADRLLENVLPALRSAFEAASIVRFFDVDTLEVLGVENASSVYSELRSWPFVLPRREGLCVHSVVREMIAEYLISRSSADYKQLHKKAVNYYSAKLSDVALQDVERIQLELLYHTFQLDEQSGMTSLRSSIETTLRYRLLNRFRVLLNEFNSFQINSRTNELWREYYNAVLANVEVKYAEAESLYKRIVSDDDADVLVRAYSLCDLGKILATPERLSAHDGIDIAMITIQQSLRTARKLDKKLVVNFISLAEISKFQAQWRKAIEQLRIAERYYKQNSDQFGLSDVYFQQSVLHSLRGDWYHFYLNRQNCLRSLGEVADLSGLRMKMLGLAWPLIWSGKYMEARTSVEEALIIAKRLDQKRRQGTRLLMTLAYCLGSLRLYEESDNTFTQALDYYSEIKEKGIGNVGVTLGFWGEILLHRGQYVTAERYLVQSIQTKKDTGDTIGLPENLVNLGVLAALTGDWDDAIQKFQEALQLSWTGRSYFECKAFICLARAKIEKNELVEAVAMIKQGEQLAILYEYHDCKAYIHLLYALIFWRTVREHGLDDYTKILTCYQQAIVCGLKYNSFFIDDVLDGNQSASFFLSIFSECTKAGIAGKIVLGELVRWWRTNPTTEYKEWKPEGLINKQVTLIELERMVREHDRPARALQVPIEDQITTRITLLSLFESDTFSSPSI